MTAGSAAGSRHPLPPVGDSSPRSARSESIRELLQILKYLSPYRVRFAVAVLALLCATLMGLSFPYLTGMLLDASVRPGSQIWDLNTIALILLATLAIQAVFSFFSTYGFSRSGESALVDMRRKTYARLVSLPMAFFHERRVGELVSRLGADMALMQDTLTGATPQFIRQCTLMLGGIVLVALTSWKLTFLMLSTFPLLMLAAVLVGKQIRGHSRAAHDRLALSTSVLEESLQGIANVKAFRAEEFEKARYSSYLDGFLRAIFRVSRLRAILISFIILGVFGSIVGVFWYGARLMQAGELSFGELTRFILYTTFIGGSVASFADLFGLLQKSLGASERLRQLVDEEPEESPGCSRPASGAKPNSEPCAVRIENVFFAYPSRPDLPVLRGLDLAAEAGEKVALVGASGAGKSTVFALLLRFYDPFTGRILLDGQDTLTLPRAAIRNRLGIVPQDILLFNGSIAENIAYGRIGASHAEIERAAEGALCSDFIAQLPEGIHTRVGDRGVTLSGGQRQRLAIARALLRDPGILLLDEATSSLDAESEQLVQKGLDRLLAGRTAFIIAHRLSTVRSADRIFVMEEGRVVEAGRHAELMRLTDGTYRRLAEIQFHEQLDAGLTASVPSDS